MSLEKSREILKSLSRILKFFAYLGFTIAGIETVAFFTTGEFIFLILAILVFFVGWIFFYLSYGLSQEEKWAWCLGLIIFSINAISGFLLFLFFQKGIKISYLGGFIIQVLLLTLLLTTSSVFRGKIEKPSSWFGKKGFLEVLIPTLLIYLLATGSLIYEVWWIPREKRLSQERAEGILKEAEKKIPNWETYSIKNWKIYQNKEYGFKIEYPEDWEVGEDICFGPSPCIYFVKTFSLTQGQKFECKFTVIAHSEDKWKFAKDFFHREGKIEKEEELTLNGIPIQMSIIKTPGSNIDYLLNTPNSKNFFFRMYTSEWECKMGMWKGKAECIITREVSILKCGDIFNQILSTFSFIE